jgi:hypothetical protein
MNVEITKVASKDFTYLTGGGCAEQTVNIMVDAGLPKRLQVRTVIHEIIESYFPCLSHDKIIELEDILGDAIEKL